MRRGKARFAMRGPLDCARIQELHGWYDEVRADGTVHRRHYSLHWRPIFRHELELMLIEAGFRIDSVEGGHRKEPYAAGCPHLFVQARKTA